MAGIKFGTSTAAIALAGIMLIVYDQLFLGLGCFVLAILIHFGWNRVFKKT